MVVLEFGDRMTLKTKIILGTVLLCGVLLVTQIISISGIRSLNHSSHWVDHTHKVLAEAQYVLADAVDMETGMRGFLLAGKDEFLELYDRGKQQLHQRIQDLKKTLSDNDEQVQLLGEIDQVMKD